MAIFKRWEVRRGAGFYGSPMGYLRPQYFPFRWMAKTQAWSWRTLNLFPGRLVAHITRVPKERP